MRLMLTIFGVASLLGCTDNPPPSESYDPPGSTITTGRTTYPQPRRTIGFQETGVWVSNEHIGARLSDFVREEGSRYRAIMRPENEPINNSAWYGFRLWSTAPQQIQVTLAYEGATHRYVPKLSADGENWTPIAPDRYAPDTTAGTATLTLDIGPDSLWVSAQERHTSDWFRRWADPWVASGMMNRVTTGTSVHGRSLELLAFGQIEQPQGIVLAMGRQHPPEVTGSLAFEAFMEAMLADSELAAAFRDTYRVLAVPLVNPDGVDEGHWRHNAAGVDLNRDWQDFNQPEVRSVRNAFVDSVEAIGAPVHFAVDFHSTQVDMMYTLERKEPTNIDGLVDRWIEGIEATVPGYEVLDEADPLGSPVSKKWFYETFGTTAVTYEVGDETDRALIVEVAEAAAATLMRELLAAGQ